MTATAQILITVVLVGAGITGYHFVAEEVLPVDLSATYATDARDLGDLERRLSALESDDVELSGLPLDQRVVQRLSVLEERVAALESRKERGSSTSVGVTERGPDDLVSGDQPTDLEGEEGLLAGASAFSKVQEKRIQDLIAKSRASRNERRGQDMLQRRLDRLGIELTDEQRTQVTEAVGAHMETVRDTVRALREDGKSREEIREELKTVNDALTESLSTFLPPADADAISTSLTQGGGQRRGPPRR